MEIKNLKISVFNSDGKAVKEVELDKTIFGVKPDTNLLHFVANAYLANKRLGLAHTKTKSEVRGGGRKPWRQKGTGRARQGSIRSPQWRGGGITFGPRSNRNWSVKINQKVKIKALAMALSAKAEDKKITLIDVLPTDGKTKSMAKLIKANKVSRTPLLIPTKTGVEILRACHNISGMQILRADSLNVLDVLKARHLILPVESLEAIKKTFFKKVSK
ncbi:MAG: 50S ribosomal protein L4 [Candidatus Kerfeldbacteria bacterium CG08_land_8_20_14_0_20_43_14]|uniref:Large ribosomal subunit protein uL4 n=1 Tax=Candidatus Kerfeldbacteria bacterium CG08_land_8_20_14_0_20_43_14 TaxID=2014246 RepID=A0A2H0YQE0_9BACT|nr:MAG: 50S ribosomal protein L4 [Candidatus Kerfeldbacteria bacterium CG08_land_8_20_14_0_20_43_14]